MHEQSLVRSLLRQVVDIRRQNAGEQVTEVRVQLGPLSGVEPFLLTSAFDQLATEFDLAGSNLVIDEVTLFARCKSCDHEFEVDGFVFRCPKCNGNVKITRGDDFQLTSVTLRGNET
jgi:hydrogenase nickel incorporation protein HypA/HybF